MGCDNIHSIFRYHPPLKGQSERYTELRRQGLALATLITDSCPPSRERSLAITRLQETIMWANAAIAINEIQEDE